MGGVTLDKLTLTTKSIGNWYSEDSKTMPVLSNTEAVTGVVLWKVVLRNSPKFTGKHQASGLQVYYKRGSGTGVFLLILWSC